MHNFNRKFFFFLKHTVADESRFDIDCCSPENFGDNDWLFWSIWFELVFNGENGDVITLGLVVDNVRLRDNVLVPFAWELFTARIDGDGTKWRF
jgi:hypothetical protein